MPRDVYTDKVKFDWRLGARDIKYNESILPKSPAFIIYDNAFEEIVDGTAKIALIEEREDMFAHEAGVYISSTKKNYFTSNYQSGKSVEIYSVSCKDSHEVEQLHYPDVVNANGGCHYNDQILFCSQGNLSAPSALVLVDPRAQSSKILLNNFHGREFNSINDVVIHHDNDDIWFTDPTYGWEQAFRPSPLLPSQVYRYKPSTGQVWCVADGFEQCNGLCFSPDYKKMYITDTGALQAHGTPGNGMNISFNSRLPSAIYEYDVVDDGTRLANRKMFAHCDNGAPDGIKCDGRGNVWSGCGDGIHVWDRGGTLIGKVFVGGVVANFNFAPGGIWAFAERRLFSIQVNATGALARVEMH